MSTHIVPFRETIVPTPKIDMVNEAIEDQNLVFKSRSIQDIQQVKLEEEQQAEQQEDLGNGLIQIQTANKRCGIRIRAIPLPGEVTRLLEEHADLIRTMMQHLAAKLSDKSDGQSASTLNESTVKSLTQLKSSLEESFANAGAKWTNALDQIWAFGPRGYGPNILLNRIPEYQRLSVWSCLEKTQSKFTLRDYDNSVINGFQLATLAGPLCEEPMMGVCFAIESVADPSELQTEAPNQQPKKNQTNASLSSSSSSPSLSKLVKRDPTSFGALTGQIMSSVREGCRRAFTSRPQRLMAAMYTCVIQATADVLGKDIHLFSNWTTLCDI